jgi:hypothetical protein
VTTHTSALDHALTEALHTATPHADSIHIEVIDRADDRTPLRYRVAAWRGASYWAAENADRMKALALAMRKLTLAVGGASDA